MAETIAEVPALDQLQDTVDSIDCDVAIQFPAKWYNLTAEGAWIQISEGELSVVRSPSVEEKKEDDDEKGAANTSDVMLEMGGDVLYSFTKNQPVPCMKIEDKTFVLPAPNAFFGLVIDAAEDAGKVFEEMLKEYTQLRTTTDKDLQEYIKENPLVPAQDDLYKELKNTVDGLMDKSGAKSLIEKAKTKANEIAEREDVQAGLDKAKVQIDKANDVAKLQITKIQDNVEKMVASPMAQQAAEQAKAGVQKGKESAKAGYEKGKELGSKVMMKGFNSAKSMMQKTKDSAVKAAAAAAASETGKAMAQKAGEMKKKGQQKMNEFMDDINEDDTVAKYSKTVAKAADKGSEYTAASIKGASGASKVYMKSAGEWAKDHMKPADLSKDAPISDATASKMKGVKMASGAAVSVSRAVALGAQATCNALAKAVTDAVEDSEYGQYIERHREGKRVGAGADAFKSLAEGYYVVYVAMLDAGVQLVKDTNEVVTDVVTYKYGPSAGQATADGLSAMSGAVESMSNIAKIKPTRLAMNTSKMVAMDLVRTVEARKEAQDSRQKLDPQTQALAMQAVNSLASKAPLRDTAAAIAGISNVAIPEEKKEDTKPKEPEEEPESPGVPPQLKNMVSLD